MGADLACPPMRALGQRIGWGYLQGFEERVDFGGEARRGMDGDGFWAQCFDALFHREDCALLTVERLSKNW